MWSGSECGRLLECIRGGCENPIELGRSDRLFENFVPFEIETVIPQKSSSKSGFP
jgi:hypothetical protein